MKISNLAARGIRSSNNNSIMPRVCLAWPRAPKQSQPESETRCEACKIKIANLPQASRRIGRRWNLRRGCRRTRIRGDLGWRGLGQTNARIHFQVFFGAAWTKSFARIIVAQACQFITAMNAVAISSNGGSLDCYKSHGVCPQSCRIVQVS